MQETIYLSGNTSVLSLNDLSVMTYSIFKTLYKDYVRYSRIGLLGICRFIISIHIRIKSIHDVDNVMINTTKDDPIHSLYNRLLEKRFMELPKLQYIQKVKVYIGMAEIYQQFIKKLISASKALKLEKSWTVYEEPFSKVKETRTFVFIRALDSWQELDKIAEEEPLSQIFLDIYGEKDAFEWLTVAQKAVKSTKTQILSSMPTLSYSPHD